MAIGKLDQIDTDVFLYCLFVIFNREFILLSLVFIRKDFKWNNSRIYSLII